MTQMQFTETSIDRSVAIAMDALGTDETINFARGLANGLKWRESVRRAVELDKLNKIIDIDTYPNVVLESILSQVDFNGNFRFAQDRGILWIPNNHFLTGAKQFKEMHSIGHHEVIETYCGQFISLYDTAVSHVILEEALIMELFQDDYKVIVRLYRCNE